MSKTYGYARCSTKGDTNMAKKLIPIGSRVRVRLTGSAYDMAVGTVQGYNRGSNLPYTVVLDNQHVRAYGTSELTVCANA